MAEKRFHFPVAILVVVLLLGLGAGAIYIWRMSLESEVDNLKEAIAFVQSQYAFAEMKVTGMTADMISVELSIRGISGDVVGSTNLTLPGQDFFLESRILIAALEDEQRAFIFPIKVYSDKMPPDTGISVESLYMKEGVPMNYYTSSIKPGMIIAMKNLKLISEGAVIYREEVQGEFIKNAFDSAVHQSFLRPFRVGDVYTYVIHPNGGIELLEGGYGNE